MYKYNFSIKLYKIIKERMGHCKSLDFHLAGTFLSSHMLVLLKPDACCEMLYEGPCDNELRKTFS